jgi:glucokinase
MKKRVAAGIDIGGTNSVYGLVDDLGKILVRGSIPTSDYPDPQELVNALSAKIDTSLLQCGKNVELVGAGIGAPNGNYFSGCVEYAPNMKWEGIVPLAEYFAEDLDCRTILTNDANAAAIGEMLFGGARGMKDFLFITLGTGLGSGIVVNGEMVYGHDGMAGELGHTIIIPGGRPCGCGRQGCLETYCSATGLRKTYLEKSGKKDTPAIDSKYIFEKAKAGDQSALDAFNLTGDLLGFALANSVAYTSPAAIFLFGGLAQAGELIFAPTRLSFEMNLLKVYQGKVLLLPSGLAETDAAILGAASLIWKETLSPVYPHEN